MRRLLFCFIILMIMGRVAYGQQDSSSVPIAKNSFFIEFCGNASGQYSNMIERFSINFDRRTQLGKYSMASFRIGSNIPIRNYYRNSTIHTIPIMVNLLVGKKKFYFEAGAGYELLFFDGDYKHEYGAFTSVLGLRYQNCNNGIIARAGITPTVGVESGGLYFGTIVGISAGYTF